MFSMTHTLGWVVFYSSILIAVKYEMPFDNFLTILSAIMFSEMSPGKKNPTKLKPFFRNYFKPLWLRAEYKLTMYLIP